MLLSQTAEYALQAAVYLAASSCRSRTNQQIADATRVPANYLCKVLQALGRAGLVEAQRGLGGGFTLSRAADAVSVLDVVNAVDPVQRIVICPLGLKGHGTHLCPLHRKLDDAMAGIEASFGSTTLNDILQSPGRSKPLCDLTVNDRAASCS